MTTKEMRLEPPRGSQSKLALNTTPQLSKCTDVKENKAVQNKTGKSSWESLRGHRLLYYDYKKSKSLLLRILQKVWLQCLLDTQARKPMHLESWPLLWVLSSFRAKTIKPCITSFYFAEPKRLRNDTP